MTGFDPVTAGMNLGSQVVSVIDKVIAAGVTAAAAAAFKAWAFFSAGGGVK